MSLLLALMLTAQMVLPAAAEGLELQPAAEETTVQELPEQTEETEETEAPSEETEAAEETEKVPEVTEEPEETEEPTEETEEPTEETEEPTEETEEPAEETVDEVAANEAGTFTTEPFNGGVRIKEYTGSDPVVQIPEELGGIPVVAIANVAFRNNKSLTEVVIPDTVTVIGLSAFQGCTSLKNVKLPKNLESLGSQAFGECVALKSIEIPQRVTVNVSLSNSPFVGSGLSNVTFAEGTTKIADYLFKDCEQLKSIEIPASVTKIGNYAFANSALEKITIPAAVTTISNSAFSGVSTLTVYGSAGTAAQTLANEKGYTFVDIGTPVTAITLTPDQVSLVPGKTALVAAKVTPDAATNKALSWSSSAPDVASVDEIGLVTGLMPGTAVITAAATDGSGVTATCQVTVTCEHVMNEGVITKQPTCSETGVMEYRCVSCGAIMVTEELPVTDHNFQIIDTKTDNKGRIYYIQECEGCGKTKEEHNKVLWITGIPAGIVAGKAVALTAKFGDGKTHPVQWSVVDGEEYVSIKKSGTKLTVTARNGLTEQHDVTVRADSDFSVLPMSVTFKVTPKAEALVISYNGEAVTGKTIPVDLNLLTQLSFAAEITPAAAGSNIQWTTNDTRKLYGTYEFDENECAVTLKQDAKLATITLTATDKISGKKATVKLTTTRISTGINVSAPADESTILGGKTLKLAAALDGRPKDATVIWSVNPDAAAYASISKGVLKVADVTEEHTIELTAKAKDGGCDPQTVTVTIQPRVTSLRLESDLNESSEPVGGTCSVSMNEVQEMTLRAVRLPEGSSASIKWSGMNESFAHFEVDEYGDLNISDIKKTGTVTLTAANSSDSRTPKATVKLTFTRHADEIKILSSSSKPFAEREDGTALTVSGGRNYTFKISAGDKTMTDKSVEWFLDDSDNIASISSKGVLTVKSFAWPSEKTVSVTAYLKSNHEVMDSVVVKLQPNQKEAFKIYDDDYIRLDSTTRQYPLSREYLNLSAMADDNVTWKSSNAAIATVSQNGFVELKKTGDVTITATGKMNGKRVTASAKLKIVNPVESVEIEGKDAVAGGKTLKLKAKLIGGVEDKAATGGKAVWSLAPNDKAYASINSSGVLTAKKVTGKKEITVYATVGSGENRIEESHAVTIYPITTSVRLYCDDENKTGKTVDFYDSMNISLESNPGDAYNSFTAKSSNRAIEVSGEGSSFSLYMAEGKTLRVGTKVTITFTAADGSGKTAKIIVKIPKDY